MLVDSGEINRGPTGESGLFLTSTPGDTDHPYEPPFAPDPNKRALQRFIGRTAPQHELPSVIEAIFSNVKTADIVECLQESDVQTFIDLLDEVRHHAIPSLRNWCIDFCSNLLISVGQALGSLSILPRTRRKCVKFLYKTCAGYKFLPRSLHFELHGDLVGAPLHSGGFGRVRKRGYCGRDVAVKVLQPRYNNGSQDISNVSDWEVSIPRIC